MSLARDVVIVCGIVILREFGKRCGYCLWHSDSSGVWHSSDYIIGDQ